MLTRTAAAVAVLALLHGNAELIGALLGGAVDALLVNVSQDIRAQFDAGEFRPLAVSPAERVGYLPDTPTLAELGFPGLTYSTSLFGLGAPVVRPRDHRGAGGGDARRPGRPGRAHTARRGVRAGPVHRRS
jgi:tripartite-type tricarboxylate transporter receptor subunit TctC